jgi:hypothetical protein
VVICSPTAKPTSCRCRRRPSSNGGYQYYFATERGALGYDKYRHDFGKLIWQIASPKWNFDDATFDRTAAYRVEVILANPVMIEAYQSGIPSNGKPFPDGSKMLRPQACK